MDTVADDNFCSMDVWTKFGKPALTPATSRYEAVNGQPLPTLGTFQTAVSLFEKGTTTRTENIAFTVSKVSRLNLLGRDAIVRLCINIPALLGIQEIRQWQSCSSHSQGSRARCGTPGSLQEGVPGFSGSFQTVTGLLKGFPA